MKRKLFHLGDILSITTGRLVSPRLMGGVYDILNYMTQDNLYTHQLPRAGDECKPWLLRQHPQLRTVDASSIDRDNWQDWLAEQVKLFGKELLVEPIPRDDHDYIEPIAELVEMVGSEKVIVVEVSDSEPSP